MLQRILMFALWALLLTAPGPSWAGEEYWIDVRTADEYAAGHVDQAVNIPYEQIVERIDELTVDKEALVYVYCRSGRRSGIAKAALEQAGFENVVNLGGLDAAQRAAAEGQLATARDTTAGD